MNNQIKPTSSNCMMYILKTLPPFRQVASYTESQNLGQNWKDVPKYKCVDELGNPTGIGYAFEDLCAKVWKDGNISVEQVAPTLNGADFIVSGEACQLKCAENGFKTAASFYRKPYGEYAYGDQTAVVPKGQLDQAKERIKFRKQMGLGEPKSIVEAPVSREDAQRYLRRGMDSFKADFTDVNIYKPCLITGLVIGATGLAYEIITNHKEITPKKAVKKIAKWGCIGTAVTLLTLTGSCLFRQNLRP